jgi:hypothetical protein
MNVAAAGVVTSRATARHAGRPAVPASIVPDAYASAIAACRLTS